MTSLIGFLGEQVVSYEKKRITRAKMAASCIKRDNSVVTVDPVLGQSKLF